MSRALARTIPTALSTSQAAKAIGLSYPQMLRLWKGKDVFPAFVVGKSGKRPEPRWNLRSLKMQLGMIPDDGSALTFTEPGGRYNTPRKSRAKQKKAKRAGPGRPRKPKPLPDPNAPPKRPPGRPRKPDHLLKHPRKGDKRKPPPITPPAPPSHPDDMNAKDLPPHILALAIDRAAPAPSGDNMPRSTHMPAPPVAPKPLPAPPTPVPTPSPTVETETGDDWDFMD